MDGLKANDVTLFLGKIPGRKQEAFYFQKDASIYVAAYIPTKNLKFAQMYWEQMLNALSSPPQQGVTK